MRVVERGAGHYDVQEIEGFCRDYRWCPEMVVIECECGERTTLKRSELISSEETTCERGAKCAVIDIQEGEVVGEMVEDDETLHPWRYWHSPKGAGIPF